MVKKLPSDFDIFSLSTCRKPLCIQTFAMRAVSKAQHDLGDLVLVVGKHEIDAAAMDVEGLALIGSSHVSLVSKALIRCFHAIAEHSMCHPGRPGVAMPPGRRPGRVLRAGRFPQHEVHRVALVGCNVHPRAGQKFVQRAFGKRAVFRNPSAASPWRRR